MTLDRNTDIREILKEKRVYYWEVAEVLGIHPSTFTAWLRHELSEDRRTKIMSAIDTVAARRESE